MIAIENTLISEDLIDEMFFCDLSLCKGCCCVEGDAGAPMEQAEIDYLEDNIEKIKPYIPQAGLDVINELGVFDVFVDGSFVTPLVNEKDCAFAYLEDGIKFCAIEKAFLNGEVTLRKPISCYLYPVRVQEYENYTAVNYHKWDICADACKKGNAEGMPVYKFLKKPLVQKFGREWYKALEVYAAHGER